MAATAHNRASERDRLVFSSIFPVDTHGHTTPTPVATPVLGSSAAGQSFGGFSGGVAPPASPSPAQRAVRREQAWSVATRFLSVPRVSAAEAARFEVEEWRGARGRSREAGEALEYLLVGEGAARADEHEQSIIDWYTNEIRMHFEASFSKGLHAIWAKDVSCKKAWGSTERTVRVLWNAQNVYSSMLDEHILQIFSQEGAERIDTPSQEASRIRFKLKRDIHAIFYEFLPSTRIFETLTYILYNTGCQVFQLPTTLPEEGNISDADKMTQQKKLRNLLFGLQQVGFGGSSAQRSLGYAVDKLMTAFIASKWARVDWVYKKSVVPKLRDWVQDGLVPYAKLVMDCLDEAGRDPAGVLLVSQVQQWEDMIVTRMGRARVDDLFDYIVNWNESYGAILDLKEYITTPAARARLTSSFTLQLSRRLLHAGATSSHILDVYTFLIRAFEVLDPKGVLLERVARPVRRYLRDRDDTARIIVSSLFADAEDENGEKIETTGDVSSEIAWEMANGASMFNDHDEELNWNDMNWVPDPSDASPDYKKSKKDNVLAHLFTLYDQEDFLNELKTVLGENLLNGPSPEFAKEFKLVELFKIRFGDDKLQACEVMLGDVIESRRINVSIRTSMRQQAAPQLSPAAAENLPELKTQILSSFFWPPLRDETFAVPAPVATAQAAYERGFESIKDMRKLHWLHALGRATVSLELADRALSLSCTTAQAAVVHAFADGADGDARTVEELEDALGMDEDLLRVSLLFWVGERVLHETAPDTYAVLERLPASGTASAAAADDAAREAAEQERAATGGGGVVSGQDLLGRNRGVYEQFVVGMLTNQGGMTKPRVLMMLKIAVPGGFPGGVEEVQALLEELEEKGQVASAGDVWSVKK